MIRIQASKVVGKVKLDFSLEVPSDRTICLFGESGIGKTTLLRLLAGLEVPDSGRLSFREETWVDTDKKVFVTPQQRKVAMVFQEPALFPHLDVAANIAFGIKQGQDRNIVNELIRNMGLEGLAPRMPHQLSGGQQQRVALARALASRPQLLLLDEPFSALDTDLKHRIQQDLIEYQKLYGLSMFVVTHSLSDVFRLSDFVIRMNKNNSIETGSASVLFGTSDPSGNFTQQAEVLKIEASGVVFVVTVLMGNQITQIIAQKESVENLKIGDLVSIETKAFSPLIRKYENNKGDSPIL